MGIFVDYPVASIGSALPIDRTITPFDYKLILGACSLPMDISIDGSRCNR